MIRKEAVYGPALISHYLPTRTARRYLDCCHVAGWHKCNIRYHWHYPQGFQYVLAFYTVNGAGWLTVDGKRYDLTKGSIALVPANTPMEYGTAKSGKESWEFYWLNLEGTFVEETVQKLKADGLSRHFCGEQNTYLRIFRELLNDSTPEMPQELVHAKLIRELMDLLLDELIFGKNVRHPSTDTRCDRIIAYMQSHFEEDITLNELSRTFYLSQNQLIRIFRKRTGYTPYEYLKRYRLTKACELLVGTDLQIREIGLSVGYVNNAHFTAQFRTLYGMTPKEYRANFSPVV